MLPTRIPDDEIPAGWHRLLWAAHQPQYEPLPAIVADHGQATRARWRLTADERRAIADGANLELTLWHYGRPLQPHRLDVQGVAPEIPEDRDQLIERERDGRD